MPRSRRTSGFTLVELLVAATVAALVVGSAGLMLSHVTAAHKRVDRQMRLQQEARAAADAIALALRNAYRPGIDDTADLLGEDGWIGEFPADRIRFYSVSWEPVRRGWPESDVRLVEFFILEPPEDLPDQQPVLMRRLDPTRNPEPDEGGVLDRVAQGVLGLDIAYYDGIEWAEEWIDRPGQWPLAIRVQLMVAAEVDDPQPLVITRLVSFPHDERTSQLAAGEPSGDGAAQQQSGNGSRSSGSSSGSSSSGSGGGSRRSGSRGGGR